MKELKLSKETQLKEVENFLEDIIYNPQHVKDSGKEVVLMTGEYGAYLLKNCIILGMKGKAEVLPKYQKIKAEKRKGNDSIQYIYYNCANGFNIRVLIKAESLIEGEERDKETGFKINGSVLEFINIIKN